MGFAAGLPLLLTLSTLSYWLAEGRRRQDHHRALRAGRRVPTPSSSCGRRSWTSDAAAGPDAPARPPAELAAADSVLLAWRSSAFGLIDPAIDPWHDGAGRVGRRVPVRQPGHRDRRLSHRAAGRTPSRAHGAATTSRLSLRHAGLGRRRAVHRRICLSLFCARQYRCGVGGGRSRDAGPRRFDGVAQPLHHRPDRRSASVLDRDLRRDGRADADRRGHDLHRARAAASPRRCRRHRGQGRIPAAPRGDRQHDRGGCSRFPCAEAWAGAIRLGRLGDQPELQS